MFSYVEIGHVSSHMVQTRHRLGYGGFGSAEGGNVLSLTLLSRCRETRGFLFVCFADHKNSLNSVREYSPFLSGVIYSNGLSCRKKKRKVLRETHSFMDHRQTFEK